MPRKNEPVAPNDQADLLTVREAASLLGTTPWGIINRIRRGRIPEYAWRKETTGLRRVKLYRAVLEMLRTTGRLS